MGQKWDYKHTLDIMKRLGKDPATTEDREYNYVHFTIHYGLSQDSTVNPSPSTRITIFRAT